MSSKASEILGVATKRPHTSARRAPGSRDGDSLLSSSRPSRYPSNAGSNRTSSELQGRGPPSRASRHPSRHAERGTTGNSIDSVPSSVRFADKPLPPTGSSLVLSRVGDNDLPPPSPSVASSRMAPSAWRGLVSRAGGSNYSIGSRTSQESMSTARSQVTMESQPKGRTLLRSALSRFTLRPSKSRNTLDSSRASSRASSTVPTATQSTVTTAMHTATTSRLATPRPASPINERIASSAPGMSATPMRPNGQPGKPKRRLNSRMPLEIDRPPTRNVYDGLDDTDFDDAQPSSYQNYVPPQPAPPFQPNGTSTPTMRSVRHFSRPLMVPPRPPAELGNHPREVLAQNSNLPNTGRYPDVVVHSSNKPKKRRSKPPELAPHDYSILNLSDSDEDAAAITQEQRVTKASIHAKAPAREVNQSLKRDTVILRQPPSQSGGRSRGSSRVISVVKADDDQAATSPSLPSLVESGSSRQTSFVSSGSRGRSIPSDSALGNQSHSSKAKNKPTVDRAVAIYQGLGDSVDTVDLPGTESEDDGFVPLQTDKRDFAPSGDPDHVMTALSPEEVAWLEQMRRSRADALSRLSPPAPALNGPNLKHEDAKDTITRSKARLASTATVESNQLEYADAVRAMEAYEVHEDPDDLTRNATDLPNGVSWQKLLLATPEISTQLDVSEFDEGHKLNQQQLEPEGLDRVKGEPTQDSPEIVALTESLGEEQEEGGEKEELGDPGLPAFDAETSPSSASTPETVTLAESQETEPKEQEQPAEPAEDYPSFSVEQSSDIVQGTEMADLALEDQHPAPSSEETWSQLIDSPNPADEEGLISSESPSTPTTAAGPRQQSISYAEARSKFERSSKRSSLLPIPKKQHYTMAKGVPSPAPSATKSPLPRIPVPLSKVPHYRQRSTMSDVSTDDGASMQEPLSPNLGSFPQPPGSAEFISSDPRRDSLLNGRRDSGAGDVLDAWRALGGGKP